MTAFSALIFRFGIMSMLFEQAILSSHADVVMSNTIKAVFYFQRANYNQSNIYWADQDGTLSIKDGNLTTMTHTTPNLPGLPPAFPTYAAYVEALSQPKHVAALLKGALVNGAMGLKAIEAIQSAPSEAKAGSHVAALLRPGLANAVAVFQVIEPTAHTVANTFAPFGLAAVGLLAIIRRAIDVAELKEEVMHCARDIATFLDTVYGYLQKSVHDPSATFTAGKLAIMLERDILLPITHAFHSVIEISDKRSRQMFVWLTPYKTKLNSCRHRLPKPVDLFMILSQLEVARGLDIIQARLDEVLAKDVTVNEAHGVLNNGLEELKTTLVNIEKRLELQDRAQAEILDCLTSLKDCITNNLALAPRHSVHAYQTLSRCSLDGNPSPPESLSSVDDRSTRSSTDSTWKSRFSFSALIKGKGHFAESMIAGLEGMLHCEDDLDWTPLGDGRMIRIRYATGPLGKVALDIFEADPGHMPVDSGTD